MSKYDAQPVTLSPMVVGSTRDGTFADGGGASLWSLIDDRLRGRWKAAIVVGFVLGTVFGIAGYLFTTPKYESAGLIRIAPNISPILRNTPETGLMPLYHNFVKTQVQLIRSQLVLERALEDETLSALPWTQQPSALRRLTKGLMVQADRGSELITVRFRAESAEVAHAAVNAVIKAYDEKYASVGGDEIGRKLRTLRERRTELRRQRNETLSAVQQFVGETAYGDGALGQLLTAKIMRREKIASDVEELEQLLVLTEAIPSEAPEDAAEGGAGPTPAYLDMFDPQLAELRRLRDGLWLRFELVKHRWVAHLRVLFPHADIDIEIGRRLGDCTSDRKCPSPTVAQPNPTSRVVIEGCLTPIRRNDNDIDLPSSAKAGIAIVGDGHLNDGHENVCHDVSRSWSGCRSGAGCRCREIRRWQ